VVAAAYNLNLIIRRKYLGEKLINLYNTMKCNNQLMISKAGWQYVMAMAQAKLAGVRQWHEAWRYLA